MKTRNKIIAAASVGLSGAAIATGAFLTSTAVASTPQPNTAKVVVVTSDTDGTGAIQCQFDNVAVASTAGHPGDGTAPAGIGSGVAPPGAVTGSGPASGDTGGKVLHTEEGTAGPGSPGVPPGAGQSGATVTGTGSDGSPPAVLPSIGQDVRDGTAAECTGLRPETIPAS